MAHLKRNSLSAARRKVLTNPEVAYTIRCPGTHCDCEHFGPDCRRGFFSLWIQAIYGRYLAAKLEVSSQIDFGDKPYLYSDPALHNGDLNFWNYYYEQEPIDSDKRKIPSDFIETYPLRIWKRSHFSKIFKLAVNNLVLKDTAQKYIEDITTKCRKYKTLGVHIRGTDHPDEVPEIPFEKVLKLLRKNLKRYQKFFIATDNTTALDQLTEEFGQDRLILQEAVRSENEQAVHTNMEHTNRYQLGLEVLADCYGLSACSKAVLVHSNVSYSALLINPRLRYSLMESKAARRSRLKTGFLYELDRCGIRKM